MQNPFEALRDALSKFKEKYTSEQIVYVTVYFSRPLTVYVSLHDKSAPVSGFVFVAQFTPIGCFLRSHNSDIFVQMDFLW